MSLVELVSETLKLSLLLVGPPLLAMMLVGLVLAVCQAATQINEQTLSFLPKLLTGGAVLFLMVPMASSLCWEFNELVWEAIAGLGQSSEFGS